MENHIPLMRFITLLQNNMANKEIEVRFLEIDKKALIKKLHKLDAKDFGENLLDEIIFESREKDGLGKFIRLRKTKNKIQIAYKHHTAHTVDGTYEIEFEVSDWDKAKAFLKETNAGKMRIQQKKRHIFELDDITIDIDTWPQVPTYVELEGPSENTLKDMAQKLGLSWKYAIFENALRVIEKYYNIFPRSIKKYTFDDTK